MVGSDYSPKRPCDSTIPMKKKSISASSGEFVGFNLLFVLLTLLLSLCLHANIHTGSILLSYGQGSVLYQGELEQKKQFSDGVGELHQIGFIDKQGNKRHFYQYHRRKRPDISLGAPLSFSVTNEGIVPGDKRSGYVFIFCLSSVLSPVFTVIFVGVLIKASSHRLECDVRSKRIHHTLHLLRWVMFVLSIAGVLFAVNRVYADFLLPEGKAQVISVTGHDSYHYQVKAFSPSTRSEFEADWHFFNNVSPATGQEVNICYHPHSGPVFARTPSDKLYSLVLLIITLAYMAFSSLILINGRISCHSCSGS